MNIENFRNMVFSDFERELECLVEKSECSKKSWATQLLNDVFDDFLKKNRQTPVFNYQDYSTTETRSIRREFQALERIVNFAESAANTPRILDDEIILSQEEVEEVKGAFTDLHIAMKNKIGSRLNDLTTLRNLRREEVQDKIRLQKEVDEQRGFDYRENLSGEMWDCIGRRPFQFKEESDPCGYLYQFRIKQEYDGFSPQFFSRKKEAKEKALNIHPAIEPTTDEAVYAFGRREEIAMQLFFCRQNQQKLSGSERESDCDETTSSGENSNQEKAPLCLDFDLPSHTESFHELGYCSCIDEENRLVIELPDLEALLEGWSCFQRKYPEKNLPDLNIISSDGIADDLSFVRAYLEHDALLSNGREFMHDHYVHIRTRICRMLRGKKEYLEEKERLCMLLEIPYQAICRAREENAANIGNGIPHEELKKMECMVGIVADIIFNHKDDEPVRYFCRGSFIQEIPGYLSPTYDRYLRRRFGNEVDCRVIGEIWHKHF